HNDGKRIHPSLTANDLEMEDEDSIEVFTEQVGGGGVDLSFHHHLFNTITLQGICATLVYYIQGMLLLSNTY
ncbi:hypothetical protein MTR67_012945, partial [Solanum verrucosum]